MGTTKSKLLVVTDLDGTLLDSSYCWEAARGSVELLHQLNFPLVLNSSKTFAEMTELANDLSITTPLIAENGGVIVVPSDSPLAATLKSDQSENGCRLEFPGLSRDFILEKAHSLRTENGYDFAGFADWNADEIARRTGLGVHSSKLAGERHATEPIIWNDSESRWNKFVQGLSTHGIRAIRGGQFIHLMGDADKASSMLVVLRLFEESEPETNWVTVALGDSENDLAMLSAADLAVVIPNAHGNLLEPTAPKVFNAADSGPVGWHDAMQAIIKDYK